jgi:hypothetical protein
MAVTSGDWFVALVAAQHQRLDRQQQRLYPQQHGMHQPNGIDGMQPEAFRRAELAGRNQLVVAGVGVDDAVATSGYVL